MTTNQRGHEDNPFASSLDPTSPSRTGEEASLSRSLCSSEHDFTNVAHYMQSVSQSSTVGRGRQQHRRTKNRTLSDRSLDTDGEPSSNKNSDLRNGKKSSSNSQSRKNNSSLKNPHLFSKLNLPSTESINNKNYESVIPRPAVATNEPKRSKKGRKEEKTKLQETQAPNTESALEESSVNRNSDQTTIDEGFFELIFACRLRSSRPEFFFYWLLLTIAYITCVVLLIVTVVIVCGTKSL